MIGKNFFRKDTIEIAKALLGKTLVKGACKGIIVETEAYKDDDASHARKKTPRSKIMHDSFGRVYVYMIYGNYYCLNFTCEKESPGAVLIRAVQPIEGIKLMEIRRKTKDILNLCNGPGKLCQAFNINKRCNDKCVGEEIKIECGEKPERIESSGRIGIKNAKELPWRFYISGNKFVSKNKGK